MILSSHTEIRTRACGFYENLYKMSWEQDGILKVFFLKD